MLYGLFTLICASALYPAVGSAGLSPRPFRLRQLLVEVFAFAAGATAIGAIFHSVSDRLEWNFDLSFAFGGVVGGFFSGLGLAIAARVRRAP